MYKKTDDIDLLFLDTKNIFTVDDKTTVYNGKKVVIKKDYTYFLIVPVTNSKTRAYALDNSDQEYARSPIEITMRLG